jgi:hypothetical protein
MDTRTRTALLRTRREWKAALERAEERRRAHVEAIRAAHATDSLQAIADELGISKTRVAQIVEGDP